jgi:hypothetical protein
MENAMKVTILPVTKRLKQIVQEHGATGWVILQNSDRCQARNDNPASFISKNNHNRWVTPDEMFVESE